MKKKIVSTALAASLVVGSLAGIPVNALSTNALNTIATNLEAKTASNWLVSKSEQIHKGIVKAEELSVVKSTYGTVAELDKVSVTKAVYDKLNKNLPYAFTEKEVLDIYKQGKLWALGDADALQAFQLGTTYDAVLQKAATAAGQTALTKEDYEALAEKIKSNFLYEFQGKDYAALLNQPEIGKAFDEKLTKVFEKAVSETPKFADIAKAYGLNGEVVRAANKELANQVPDYYKALDAVAKSAVRAHANLKGKSEKDGTSVVFSVYGSVYGTVYADSVTDAVYSSVYEVTYKDYKNYIELELDEESKKVVTLVNGVLKTKGTKDELAYVTAYHRRGNNKELLINKTAIRVPYIKPGTDGGNNSGPGWIGGPISPGVSEGVLINYVDYFKELEKKLAELKARLASAVSADEKNRVLAEIDALLQKSYADITKLNVKKFVTVKDGVARLKLDHNDLNQYIDEVAKQYKKWSDLFKNVKSDIVLPPFGLTLDAGTHDVKQFHVSLSKSLQESFKKKDAKNASVVTNGLRTTLNVDAQQQDVEWKTTSKQETKFNNSPIVASDVYKYDFVSKLSDGAVKATLPLSASFKLPSRALIVAEAGKAKGTAPVDGKYEVAIKTGKEELAITGLSVSYNDIGSVRAWAGPKIDFISSLGIMVGVGNNKFAPKAPTTRGEVAKMFVLAFELEAKQGGKSFSDVSNSKWYAKYINAAADNGVLSGYPNGTFKPDQKISRAEFAAMAVRLLQKKHGWKDVSNPDAVLSKFKDAKSIHPSLKDDVALAVEKGIIVGDKGKLNPNNSTNRAESATILYRLLNNIK